MNLLRLVCGSHSCTPFRLGRVPVDAGVARAAALLLLAPRQLANYLIREVALDTWSARLHSRTVVRPGRVLLGGIVPNVLGVLSLWVLHAPSCA
jgi:hypothetical protein